MNSVSRRRASRNRSLTQDELAQLRQEAMENLVRDTRQTASDIYQGLGNFASFLKENPESGALLAGMFAPGAATVEASGLYPDPMNPEVNLPSLAALALPGEEQNLFDAGLLGLGLAGDAVQGITVTIPGVNIAGMLIGGILKAPSKLDDIAGLYKQARELDPLYDKYKAAQEKLIGLKYRDRTPEQQEALDFLDDFKKRADAGEKNYVFARETDNEIKAAEKDLEKQEQLKAEASLDEIPVEALQKASDKTLMIKSGSLAGKLSNQEGAFVSVDELPEFSELFGGVLNTDEILRKSLSDREQISNINKGGIEGIRGRPLIDPLTDPSFTERQKQILKKGNVGLLSDIAGPSRAEPVLYYTNTGKVLYNDGLINNVFTDKKTGVVNSSLPASTVAARLVGNGQNPMVRKYAPITKNDAELHGLIPFLEAKGDEPVTIADLRNVYEQNKIEIRYTPIETETTGRLNSSSLGRYGQHFTPQPGQDIAELNALRAGKNIPLINYRVVDIEEGLVSVSRGGLKVDDINALHYTGLPEGGMTYDQLGHVRFATIDDLVPVLDRDIDTNEVIQGMTIPVSDNPAVVDAITGKTGRVVNEIQFDYRDQLRNTTDYFEADAEGVLKRLTEKQDRASQTFSDLTKKYNKIASGLNTDDLGGLTLNDIVGSVFSKASRQQLRTGPDDFDVLGRFNVTDDELLEFRRLYGSDAGLVSGSVEETVQNLAGIRADFNNTDFDLEVDEALDVLDSMGYIEKAVLEEGGLDIQITDKFIGKDNPLDSGAGYLFNNKLTRIGPDDDLDPLDMQRDFYNMIARMSDDDIFEHSEELAQAIYASKMRQDSNISGAPFTASSVKLSLLPAEEEKKLRAIRDTISTTIKEVRNLTEVGYEQLIEVNNAIRNARLKEAKFSSVLSPTEKADYIKTGKPFADEYIKQANTRRLIDEFQKAGQGSDTRKQLMENVTDPELKEMLLVADSTDKNAFERFGEINEYQQKKMAELENALQEFEKSDPKNYKLFRDVQNKKKRMPPVFEDEKDFFKFVVHQQVRDAFSRGDSFVSIPRAEDIAGHPGRPGVYVEDYERTYTEAVNEVFDELVAENPDLLVKDELRITSASDKDVTRPEKKGKKEINHPGLAQRGLTVPSLILLDDTQQIKSSFRAPFKKGGLVELRKGIGGMARKVL